MCGEHVFSPGCGDSGEHGFTLLELIIVLAIICVMSAIAVPAFSSLYGDFCLKAAAWELEGMIKETKQQSLDGQEWGVVFDKEHNTASLVTARREDKSWGRTVRTFRFVDKGGGITLGYGSHGPVPKLVAAPNGTTYDNNTFVCTSGLTGSSGTVYFSSASTGTAMALVTNTRDFSCTRWRWSGEKWAKM